MKKRFVSALLAFALVFSFSGSIYACNEKQTDTYVSKIIFGDNAARHQMDKKTEMLLDALYICSEQSDESGQDKLNNLKDQKIWSFWNSPSLAKININSQHLLDCSHNSWEYVFLRKQKEQSKRKSVLTDTVKNVFDIKINSSLEDKIKAESFAQLLYYSHILCDYIADEPENTGVSFNIYNVKPYSGKTDVVLNGNIPNFTDEEKKLKIPYVKLSPLDKYGRCGSAFAVICKDTLATKKQEDDIQEISPTGWKQTFYPGNVINSKLKVPLTLYNRSHLIARSLAEGHEPKVNSNLNLITGTAYFNQIGMRKFEDEMSAYLSNETKQNNHILYRVTPVFIGQNKVASGVQMEAYSIEDSGFLSFNVFCYNVQPGINIDYSTGTSSFIDTTFEKDNVIPFAVVDPSDGKPDLMYKIKKQLEIIFEDQKNAYTYQGMMDKLNSIESKARKTQGQNGSNQYIKLKEYEYDYLETLSSYVPLLLEKEDFFKKVFD